MDLQLEGKKVLITGASRGLGYATARRLALEGAHVMINSRSREIVKTAALLQEETNGRVLGVEGDVTRLETAQKLVDTTSAAFDGLDILITNSGGPSTGRFETFDDDAWQYAVELSFLSHVRLIRAALPLLRKSAVPSVLTVTSFTVKFPLDNLILSNSIRAATVSLTKSLSIELGGEGIRFNSILPGWTQTERVDQIMETRASTKGTTREEETAAQAAAIPLQRMADPDEFARSACFLVSPAASYINGVMLQVDGGVIRGLL